MKNTSKLFNKDGENDKIKQFVLNNKQNKRNNTKH